MSDFDFEEDDDIGIDADELLTEAEFLGYHSPKGRELLLNLRNEKALAILIECPHTALEEAVRLSTELLERFPNAALDGVSNALLAKGLSFARLRDREPLLAASLKVNAAFAEAALQRGCAAELHAVLRFVRKEVDWQHGGPLMLKLVDLVHLASRLPDAPAFYGSWEGELVRLVLAQHVVLATNAERLCNLLVGSLLCTGEYEQAWDLMIQLLSGSASVHAHSEQTVDRLHCLELLSPRGIALGSLLKTQLRPSPSVAQLLSANALLELEAPSVALLSDALKSLVILDTQGEPVTACLRSHVHTRLRRRLVQRCCDEPQVTAVAEVERLTGEPFYAWAHELGADYEVRLPRIARKVRIWELEREAARALVSRFEPHRF